MARFFHFMQRSSNVAIFVSSRLPAIIKIACGAAEFSETKL